MKFIEAEQLCIYGQKGGKGIKFNLTMLEPKVTSFSFMYKTKQLFRKQT